MWFRLYTDILNDPKVQRLSADDFKGWINILALSKEHEGLLPSTDDVAFRLRITESEAERLVETLTNQGLLDPTDDGLTPHNWDGRQFLSDDDPTAALRARRYRSNKRVTNGVTRDVTDASRPPEAETDSETETETESEQSREAARVKPRSPKRPTQCDDEFLAELQTNPAYSVFDVKAIFHRMVAWCNVKGKQPTRARLVNWLNREDRPMTAVPKKPTGNAYVGKTPALSDIRPDIPASEYPECGTNNAWMAECVDEFIAAEDIIALGEMYDAIIKRGGPKLEWEIRCVAWYELRKNEPATPEQVAQINASIRTLAQR